MTQQTAGEALLPRPPRATSQEYGAMISSRKRFADPDYMLQGFVTKSLFSFKVDPFQCK